MARGLGRGEIWTYEFRPPDKIRPVLVLSRQKTIELLHTVIVAPISSTIRDIDTEVVIGAHEGLKRPSAISLDNVRAVEQARIRKHLGSLSDAKMHEVCRALAIATGCA